MEPCASVSTRGLLGHLAHCIRRRVPVSHPVAFAVGGGCIGQGTQLRPQLTAGQMTVKGAPAKLSLVLACTCACVYIAGIASSRAFNA